MISIVVPVMNEEGNITLLYQKVESALSKIGQEFEIIFVDDGSYDQSANKIRDLHSKDARIKLLSFSRNFGHQIALTAGLDNAKGDAVIVMDADLQHPPELLPTLIGHWEEGYDIVYTIREKTDDVSFMKKFTSRLFYKLFRKFAGIKLPMNTADFRLLDRKVVDSFLSIRERTRFLRGLTTWVGYKSKAVSYHAKSRHSGDSKYSFMKMFRLSLEAIFSFSTTPLIISIYLGFFMFILSLFLVMHVVYIKYFTDKASSGWATLIVLITLIGGVQLIVLGFVGMYIGKIYEETKKRPLYIIREVVGIDEVTMIG
jgi:dolichol-phosphate mannosyltransferase